VVANVGSDALGKINRLKNEFGYRDIHFFEIGDSGYTATFDRGSSGEYNEHSLEYLAANGQQWVIRKFHAILFSPLEYPRRQKEIRCPHLIDTLDIFAHFVLNLELERVEQIRKQEQKQEDLKDYWLKNTRPKDFYGKYALSTLKHIKKTRNVCKRCGNNELIELQFRDTGQIQTYCPSCMNVGGVKIEGKSSELPQHEPEQKPKRWANIEFE